LAMLATLLATNSPVDAVDLNRGEQKWADWYTTQQLDYKPPSNSGDPSYQDQWNDQSKTTDKEINQKVNARKGVEARAGRNQTSGAASAAANMQTMRAATQPGLSAAEGNLAAARAMRPQGPTSTQKGSLTNAVNAGGRLDTDKNGIVDEYERQAALSVRNSFQRLDQNRDGTTSDQETRTAAPVRGAGNSIGPNASAAATRLAAQPQDTRQNELANLQAESASAQQDVTQAQRNMARARRTTSTNTISVDTRTGTHSWSQTNSHTRVGKSPNTISVPVSLNNAPNTPSGRAAELNALAGQAATAEAQSRARGRQLKY
jgi:hypothetical protein